MFNLAKPRRSLSLPFPAMNSRPADLHRGRRPHALRQDGHRLRGYRRRRTRPRRRRRTARQDRPGPGHHRGSDLRLRRAARRRREHRPRHRPARGVPDTVSAVTVHRNCASGFESVTQAAEKMMVGRGDVFMVGGTENMSLVPLLYSAAAAKKFTALARAKTLKDKTRRRRELPAGGFQAAHRSCRWVCPTRSAA